MKSKSVCCGFAAFWVKDEPFTGRAELIQHLTEKDVRVTRIRRPDPADWIGFVPVWSFRRRGRNIMIQKTVERERGHVVQNISRKYKREKEEGKETGRKNKNKKQKKVK